MPYVNIISNIKDTDAYIVALIFFINDFCAIYILINMQLDRYSNMCPSSYIYIFK